MNTYTTDSRDRCPRGKLKGATNIRNGKEKALVSVRRDCIVFAYISAKEDYNEQCCCQNGYLSVFVHRAVNPKYSALRLPAVLYLLNLLDPNGATRPAVHSVPEAEFIIHLLPQELHISEQRFIRGCQ